MLRLERNRKFRIISVPVGVLKTIACHRKSQIWSFLATFRFFGQIWQFGTAVAHSADPEWQIWITPTKMWLLIILANLTINPLVQLTPSFWYKNLCYKMFVKVNGPKNKNQLSFRFGSNLFGLGGFEISKIRYWKQFYTFKSFTIRVEMKEILPLRM